MEQRRIYKCWNCRRNYSLLRELDGQLEIAIICPFCYKEGIVDLNHYLEEAVEVVNSTPPHQNHAWQTLNLPEIILTAQSVD